MEPPPGAPKHPRIHGLPGLAVCGDPDRGHLQPGAAGDGGED